MPTNYNFQEIWSRKNTEVPNVEEIKAKAEKYRKKQILKDFGLIALLSVSALTVGVIWIFADFSYLTTKFGLILLLIGVSSYSYLVGQNVNILKKVSTAATNQEYLTAMKQTEKQQIYMQTTGLSFYYLILSAGFAFYFYEFALRMSWLGIVTVYGVTFLWCMISWFIIRPRQIRKQKEKISAVITALERLENNFKE